MSQKAVLIDVDNVSVQRGSETALSDVSFCIHHGERVGIIGPNGAGKSTLLEVLVGNIKPGKGTVTYGSGKVAYVPQGGDGYNGIIPMSVWEVVMLGSGGDKKRATRALKEVNIESVADRKINNLSGGQRQRVIIAKALASQPKLLILDEPTTGIDQKAEADFYGLLEKLSDNGIAIILVGHEIETVKRYAERIICLKQTIVYDGTAKGFATNQHLPEYYADQHHKHHREHHV